MPVEWATDSCGSAIKTRSAVSQSVQCFHSVLMAIFSLAVKPVFFFGGGVNLVSVSQLSFVAVLISFKGTNQESGRFHPWPFWVISKLWPPLSKFHLFHLLALAHLKYKKKGRKRCIHLGYQGFWFRLGHCQNDQIICTHICADIKTGLITITTSWATD